MEHTEPTADAVTEAVGTPRESEDWGAHADPAVTGTLDTVVVDWRVTA